MILGFDRAVDNLPEEEVSSDDLLIPLPFTFRLEREPERYEAEDYI